LSALPADANLSRSKIQLEPIDRIALTAEDYKDCFQIKYYSLFQYIDFWVNKG